MRVRFQAGTSAPAPAKDHQPAPAPSSRDRFRYAKIAVAVLLAVGVLAVLAGCGTSGQKARAWKVEPVMDVRHGASSSGAYYMLGRYHDGSQAWDKSIDAYRKAIGADASNVEACNALGVALARTYRYESAEAALRKAAGMAPGSAHIRSNLGLVLMLAGRPRDAIGELKTALTLDPDNQTARNNLREAVAQWDLQQGSTAAPSLVPPAALVRGLASMPAAAVSTPAPAAAATPAGLRVIDRPTVSAFPTDVVAGVREPPTQTPDRIAQMSLPALPVAVTVLSVHLELSNGNGIQGAASRLKQWLRREGLQVSRLTNQRPYVQQRTVIQYRAGQQQAALLVARALRMTAHLDAAPSTYLRPDVRVVLGHDWARTAACLENSACERPATLAVASQQDR